MDLGEAMLEGAPFIQKGLSALSNQRATSLIKSLPGKYSRCGINSYCQLEGQIFRTCLIKTELVIHDYSEALSHNW